MEKHNFEIINDVKIGASEVAETFTYRSTH